MEATVETLSSAEAVRLRELEAIIERGREGYIETGLALEEIRDSRLYRQTHRTFEEYVKERWDLERTRAYALMQAASDARAMSEKSDMATPRCEAHSKAIRPLLRRDLDTAVDLLIRLRDRHGKLTAPIISAAVKAHFAAERGRIRLYGSVARQPQLRLDLNSPWDFDRELRRLEDKLACVRSDLVLVVGGKADRESLIAEVEDFDEIASLREALLGYLDSGGLTDVASGLAPVPPGSRQSPSLRDRNEPLRFAAALSPGRGKPE